MSTIYWGDYIYTRTPTHVPPNGYPNPGGASNCLILRTFSVLTWIMVEVLVSNLFRVRMLRSIHHLMPEHRFT